VHWTSLAKENKEREEEEELVINTRRCSRHRMMIMQQMIRCSTCKGASEEDKGDGYKMYRWDIKMAKGNVNERTHSTVRMWNDIP
jgi:hypothetical protein